MFFGQGITVRLVGLFDTHPPLEERIARVESALRALELPQAPRRRGQRAGAAEDAGEGRCRRSGRPPPRAPAGGAAPTWAPRGAARRATARALVGSMDGAKVDYAARLLAALPRELRESLREPDGARAALVALLLAPKDDVMKLQLDALAAKGDGHARRAGARRVVAADARPRRGLPPAGHRPRAARGQVRARGGEGRAGRGAGGRRSTPTGASRCTSSWSSRWCATSSRRAAGPAPAGSKRLADLRGRGA